MPIPHFFHATITNSVITPFLCSVFDQPFEIAVVFKMNTMISFVYRVIY